jgi:hypothetical protein
MTHACCHPSTGTSMECRTQHAGEVQKEGEHGGMMHDGSCCLRGPRFLAATDGESGMRMSN